VAWFFFVLLKCELPASPWSQRQAFESWRETETEGETGRVRESRDREIGRERGRSSGRSRETKKTSRTRENLRARGRSDRPEVRFFFRWVDDGRTRVRETERTIWERPVRSKDRLEAQSSVNRWWMVLCRRRWPETRFPVGFRSWLPAIQPVTDCSSSSRNFYVIERESSG
jgi:hypothetical protein